MSNSILFKQIVFSISRHKSRTILAVLGIFWGTLSVILLMSLGDSFYLYQKNAMDTIADGKTLVFFGQTQLAYQGKPPGQIIHMRTADLALLKKSIPGLSQSTPIIGDCKRNQCPNIRSTHNRKRSPILGVDTSYADMLHLKMTAGSHFFSADDVKRQSHEIILGDELNQYLFPYGDSIGQHVTLSGIPFTVIGVLTPDRTGQPGSAWTTYCYYPRLRKKRIFFNKSKPYPRLKNTKLIYGSISNKRIRSTINFECEYFRSQRITYC